MAPHIAFDWAFDWRLDCGQCVGLWLPERAASGATGVPGEEILFAAERAMAASLGRGRRRSWVGGRVALREALIRLGVTAPALLADDRGAPVLPLGITGSVSHKDARPSFAPSNPNARYGIAVALVARERQARIGVDVEYDVPGSIDIASRVLTEDEIAEVAPLGPEERAREVLLRFSAKEAIYKALDPFVRRYVAFNEVAVSPRPDGSARVHTRLRQGLGEGSFDVRVWWRRFQGLVVTTARVDPC